MLGRGTSALEVGDLPLFQLFVATFALGVAVGILARGYHRRSE